MADSKQLTSWLLENSNRLNLQATEFAWVRDWNLRGYHDIQVNIDVAGKTFTGRGTALGEDFAFLKAGAEAIERAYCGGHHIHSTGVAAHTHDSGARENVQNELNERDAFFCHFYTKTPFLLLPDSYLFELMQTFKGAFDEILPRGINIRLFRAHSKGWPVFVCVASGLRATPQWGGIIGLGSQANEWRAIQIALLECLRNVAATVINGVPQSMSRDEFERILKPTSQDRQRLAFDVDYWKEISVLFPENKNQIISDALFVQAPSVWPWIVEKLDCPFEELKEAPIVVYRARLDESGGDVLFRGKDRSPTTLRRLSEFLRNPVARENLELRPHFLG
jgi:hypothetical protein